MTRTVFRGGSVFDGTGSDPQPADVAVEDGRIVDVGTGLDGDDGVDVAGRTLLPGPVRLPRPRHHQPRRPVAASSSTPFSYQFYEAARNLEATLRAGVTTVRDAGGADLGIKQAVADGLIDGPRMQISLAMLSQTGGHGDGWCPGPACRCSRRTRACRRASSTGRTRCGARSASCTAWART